MERFGVETNELKKSKKKSAVLNGDQRKKKEIVIVKPFGTLDRNTELN